MAYTYNYPHPAVSVDIVIFTIRDDALNVLLVERGLAPHQGEWALPGGFIRLDESLKHAAWRELKEETGVNAAYLEQLYTFGHPKRDPRERVISVAYFALLPSDKLEIRAASDARNVAWFDIREVPDLAFDHDKILRKARQRLAAKIDYSTIALQLMPETFTLPQLHHVYELIRGTPIDKRNFRKRVRALEVIEPTGDERRTGARRPAKLYRLIDRNRVDVIK